MKTLVFDAGPIISLTMNNLLWLLEPLQKKFRGDFYITEAVRKEVVDKPLATRMFKLEALQIQQAISSGFLKIVDNRLIEAKSDYLFNLSNSCFSAKGHPVRIVHIGEISTIAAAINLGSSAVAIDESITRNLIEKPESIAKRMESRLHTKVSANRDNLLKLTQEISKIKVIRSVELAAIAYETGMLEKLISPGEEKSIPNLKRTLLESVLWGVKLNGCSVSEKEINQIIEMESV